MKLYHPRASATAAGSAVKAARRPQRRSFAAPRAAPSQSTTANRAVKGRQPTASASRKKAGAYCFFSQKNRPQTVKAKLSTWAWNHTPPLHASQKKLADKVAKRVQKAQARGAWPVCQKQR